MCVGVVSESFACTWDPFPPTALPQSRLNMYCILLGPDQSISVRGLPFFKGKMRRKESGGREGWWRRDWEEKREWNLWSGYIWEKNKFENTSWVASCNFHQTSLAILALKWSGKVNTVCKPKMKVKEAFAPTVRRKERQSFFSLPFPDLHHYQTAFSGVLLL